MTPTPGKVRELGRRRLDAWKGIAQYLGRDVTTVRRWEKREGLPVHRHVHEKLGSVYAFTDEVDEWGARRSAGVPAREPEAVAAVPDPPPQLEPRVFRPGRIAWIASGGLTVAIVALGFFVAGALRTPSRQTSSTLRPSATLKVALAPPAGVVVESLEISPDGAVVVFAGRDHDGTRLWIQQLQSASAEVLPGTAGATFPFWSPDGQSAGFFADGRLKRIAVATREVHDLAAAPEGFGGTWNRGGQIIFAPNRGSGLVVIDAERGGNGTPITVTVKGFKEGHAWPRFLPDGEHFLYTDYTADARRFGIQAGNIRTGQTRRVLAEYSSARYWNGLLIYADGALVARPFDLGRLETHGEKTVIADRVLQFGDLGFYADFSVSDSGTVIARSADEENRKLLWIETRTGKSVGTLGAPAFYSNPIISPDGKSVAVSISEGERDRVWLFDLATGDAKPLTAGVIDFGPIWSSDGTRIWFASVGRRPSGIFERVLGDGIDRAVEAPSNVHALESRSRDGRYVTFSAVARDTKFDVWGWRVGEQQTPFRVLVGPHNEGHSRLSPEDGRLMAYTSDESGRFEVYVRSFPQSDGSWQVSTGGGADPLWSPDGKRLYFIALDRTLMVTDVATDKGFRTGPARPLFQTGIETLWQDTRNHYDITPDGSRILLLLPENDRRRAPFIVIDKWQGAPSKQ